MHHQTRGRCRRRRTIDLAHGPPVKLVRCSPSASEPPFLHKIGLAPERLAAIKFDVTLPD